MRSDYYASTSLVAPVPAEPPSGALTAFVGTIEEQCTMIETTVFSIVNRLGGTLKGNAAVAKTPDHPPLLGRMSEVSNRLALLLDAVYSLDSAI